MSNDLNLFDEYGDKICEIMSYHFMCEGSRCEDAHEMFEVSNEYYFLKRENIINKILTDD